MRALAVVLKGLGGLMLGPLFTVSIKSVEYLAGRTSLSQLLLSVGLSGLVDLAIDTETLGLVENASSEFGKRLIETVVGEILDSGVEELLSPYRIRQLPSGIYAAETALVSVSGDSPHVERILVPGRASHASVWSPRAIKTFDVAIDDRRILDENAAIIRKLEGKQMSGRALRGNSLYGRTG